jgi:hypothetical protein
MPVATDRFRTRLPWLGLLVLVAGCGSTVQGTGSLTDSTSAGLSAPTGGVTAGNGIAGGTTSAGASGAAASGATSSSGATQVQSGSVGAAASTTVAKSVTATTITVGVSYTENASTANAALGGKGITTGNEKADAQIAINDINAHGGILGRKVVAVFNVRDAQSTDNVASQAQAECTFFTQDKHVAVAFLGNGPIDWAEKPCLNAAGVPAITSHIASLDDADPRLRADVDVAGMDEMHLAAAMMHALAVEGWYSPWNSTTGVPGTAAAKTGVISYDLPAVVQAVKSVVLPALQQAGHPAAAQDVFQIPVPQSTADDSTAEGALQNAMLRLRGDGVDHLVLVDNGGAMTLLFSNDAFSQHYFPRYAGTSANGFQALLDGGDIQPSTMAGAVGAGWEPVIDLPFTSSAKGAFMTSTRGACLALMQKHGQSFSDSNSEAVALGYCDKLHFFQQAEQIAGAVGLAAFESAVDRVGAFASYRGLGSTFRFGWHDGGSTYVDLVFDSDCGCMSYHGQRQAVS